MTNWVERRWQHGQQLEKQAPELWSQVRNAIQDACGSFKQCYRDGPTVECTLENGKRIRIVIKRGGRQIHEVIVSYDNDLRFIDVANDRKTRYEIDADKNGTTYIKNTSTHGHVTPDELSEEVLQPLLFGEDAE